MEQKQNTALLVMDMQAAMVGMIPEQEQLLANVASAIAHARSSNMPVIYVVVGFRPGTPEISDRNKGFASGRQMFASIASEDFIRVHEAVAPAQNEVTVIKRRVSAFTGSDLEVVLRAGNIDHMVLTGIATSGVVLSTLREAADKDYHITVLSDSCADRDEEVHQVLLGKVFPRQATVSTTAEWCGA